MCYKMREADIRRKTRTKATSNFLRRVMPDRELSTPNEPGVPKELIVPKVEVKTPAPTFLRHLERWRPLNKNMKMT